MKKKKKVPLSGDLPEHYTSMIILVILDRSYLI